MSLPNLNPYFLQQISKKLHLDELISRKYRRDLVKKLEDRTQLTGSYLLLLICSTIVATLGLVTNSSAVVIGAMLIAPLFWPIFGLSLGIAAGHKKIANQSIKAFSTSFLLVILVSFSVASLTPLNQVTSEIMARSNPNLLDLMIALAASLIGIMAIYYPRISSTAIGVAISLAVLPPLAAAGIGLAKGSTQIFLGSLLLFSANTAAMVVVSAVVLRLLKFRSKSKKGQNKSNLSLGASFLFLLLLTLPLSLFLQRATYQYRIRKQTKQTLEQTFNTLLPQAKLEEVEVVFASTLEASTLPLPPTLTESFKSAQPVKVEALVLLPQEVSLTQTDQETLSNKLKKATQAEIELELNLIKYTQLPLE